MENIFLYRAAPVDRAVPGTMPRGRGAAASYPSLTLIDSGVLSNKVFPRTLLLLTRSHS